MARFADFRRYPRDGYIAGVCAGIGAYMGWSIKLIRALAVLAFLLGGGFPVILVYVVLWYVMDADQGRLPVDPGSSRYRASYSDSGLGTASSASAASDGAGSRSTGGASMGDIRGRFSRMEDRLRSMEACVASNDYELRRELRKLES